MLRLLAHLACERVVVDQDTNQISVLSILQDLNVAVFPGATIPEKALAPMFWSSFSLWESEDSDHGVSFDFKTSLESPSGQILTHQEITTSEVTKPAVRVITKFSGFPISEQGSYHVLQSIRKNPDGEWEQVSTFRITVKHVPTEDATPSETKG